MYRSKPNSVIRRPLYTILTIEKKLPLLKNAKVFTIVDVSEAFHMIELDDESMLLTTFMGPDGRYCFTRMPFGISLGQENIDDDSMNFFMGSLESSTLRTIFAYLGVVTP